MIRMKYLKGYCEVNESSYGPIGLEETKEIYSQFINWEMIEEAKDMALDYIDKGATLTLAVCAKDTIIYQLLFNHDNNEFEWFNHIYFDVDGHYEGGEEDLKYYFDLTSLNNGFMEDTWELKTRIKRAYPDEYNKIK